MSSDNEFYAPLSDFESEKVEWLWPYYLGAGILTVMDGDPGVGKSFLAMQIAAQFSVGGSLPGISKVQRRRVLYLTREDDPAFTIRPRIDAMGGDASRIDVQAKFDPFDQNGMKRLWRWVKKHPPRLIVIDPLYSFVGADADIYRPNEIRQVLAELQEVANDNGAAILAIRHLRKMKSDKAIYQGAGAIDVIGVARCGLLVAEDPDDPGRKIIAHSKHNLSKRMESIAYRLVDQGEDEMPRFEWAGTSTLSADELTGASSGSSTQPRSEAADFLKELLKDGPVGSKMVEEQAEERGISRRTLNRAKSDLGVVSKQRNREWFLSMK